MFILYIYTCMCKYIYICIYMCIDILESGLGIQKAKLSLAQETKHVQ